MLPEEFEEYCSRAMPTFQEIPGDSWRTVVKCLYRYDRWELYYITVACTPLFLRLLSNNLSRIIHICRGGLTWAVRILTRSS